MEARLGVHRRTFAHGRKALRELGRRRVELLLFHKMTRPIGLAGDVLAGLGKRQELVDGNQAGAERGCRDLLGQLLDAPQIRVNRDEPEVALGNSRKRNELETLLLRAALQPGRELVHRRTAFALAEPAPAAAIDPKKQMQHPPTSRSDQTL